MAGAGFWLFGLVRWWRSGSSRRRAEAFDHRLDTAEAEQMTWAAA